MNSTRFAWFGHRPVMVAALAWMLAPALVFAASVPPPTKAFLQKHCTDCHDAETQKGKVRLDNLAADFTAPASAELWGRVFTQLERREMPPKKKAQPSDAEREAIL